MRSTWADLRHPDSASTSLLAALTTWLTLLSWSGFAEHPSGFLVPVLVACLGVAVLGMLLRAAALSAPLVLLVQAVVVLGWLHHRWAGGEALGGWLPTGDSLGRFEATLQASVQASQSFAAPVPASVPALYPMLILAGALTAVLVDFLACGLRRAPLAGLPLLAVYTAPVSILGGGVSWVRFAFAALAFLALLVSEESRRLSTWGGSLTDNEVHDSRPTRVGSQALWSSARTIGVTATSLAVVVPLVVPTLSSGLFGAGGNGPGGNGNGVSISNPIVDLRRDLARGADQPLVQITTTEPSPAYLRISVLDSFDGTTWRPSGRKLPTSNRADGRLPRPPGLDPGTPTTTSTATVRTTGAFESRWLPTPSPLASIRAPGDWRYDDRTLDFLSAADGQTAAGLSFRVRELSFRTSARQLADAGPAPSSIYGPETALPQGLPPLVGRLARQVTRGSDNPFAQAVALQRWFRDTGGFRYSLAQRAGNGNRALVRFLSKGPDGRVGYCEQFAAAMAVMGRELQIPSRVVVGFLRPERLTPHTFVFSSHDLHAWPEMYFEGTGWVRFEPTPQARTGGAVPSYSVATDPSSGPLPSASASATSPQQNRIDAQTAAQAEQNTAGGSASGAGSWWGWLPLSLLLLVLLPVLLPRLVRSWRRERRWRAAAGSEARAVAVPEAAWSELRDSAVDLGLAWDDRVSLRRTALRLSTAFGPPRPDSAQQGRPDQRGSAANPEAVQALRRLVRQVERARFARRPVDEDTTASALRGDVETCIAALASGARRSSRRRALWLPTSLLGRRSRRRASTTPRSSDLAVDHAV